MEEGLVLNGLYTSSSFVNEKYRWLVENCKKI